jgi:hypothetical protein
MFADLHRSHTPRLLSICPFLAKYYDVPLFRIAQRNHYILFSSSRGNP